MLHLQQKEEDLPQTRFALLFQTKHIFFDVKVFPLKIYTEQFPLNLKYRSLSCHQLPLFQVLPMQFVRHTQHRHCRFCLAYCDTHCLPYPRHVSCVHKYKAYSFQALHLHLPYKTQQWLQHCLISLEKHLRHPFFCVKLQKKPPMQHHFQKYHLQPICRCHQFHFSI